MASLQFLLVFSFALYAVGVYGILSRRSIIKLLISIEILFNAILINVVAYALAYASPEGLILFIVGLSFSAAETAMSLALALIVKRRYGTVDISKVNSLKG